MSSTTKADRSYLMMQKYYVGFVLAVLILLNGMQFIGSFWNNLGWVSLNNSTRQASLPTTAVVLFEQASRFAPSSSTSLALGMAHAAHGDEAQATAIWQEGEIEYNTLLALGQKQTPDIALIYFRSAEILQPTTANIRIGLLCQQLQNQLSNSLSLTNAQYCRDYFQRNEGNLLLNGQFDLPHTLGWQILFTLKMRDVFEIEEKITAGHPAPSLQLRINSDETHQHGIYQRLGLEPGTQIKFSGYFRAENSALLNVRFLYLEWQEDGLTIGNAQQDIVFPDYEWVYLERDFTLPQESQPWLQAYPLLVSGQGTVWVDNVRLTIVKPTEAIR